MASAGGVAWGTAPTVGAGVGVAVAAGVCVGAGDGVAVAAGSSSRSLFSGRRGGRRGRRRRRVGLRRRAAAEEGRAALRADGAARDELGRGEGEGDGREGDEARGERELPLAPGERLAVVQGRGRPGRLRQRVELLRRRRGERVERLVVAVEDPGAAPGRDGTDGVDRALEHLGHQRDDDRRHRGGEHRARSPHDRDQDRRRRAGGAGDQEGLDGQAVLRALLTHAPPR